MDTTAITERDTQGGLEGLIVDAQRDIEDAQQLAIDASKLLSMSRDRLSDYRNSGFFKRCWYKFSGKLDELSRANQNDMIKMQAIAAKYLEALQKQNLLQAESIAVIRNNLRGLADVEAETREVIIKLMEQFDDRIRKLEKVVPILDWLSTIEAAGYDRLPPLHRMLKVAFDLFGLMQDEKISFERVKGRLYLASALKKVKVDIERTLTISDFVATIIDELLDDTGEAKTDRYRTIVSLVVDGEAVSPKYILENVSGSGFNAVYTILDRLETIKEIEPHLAEEKRTFLNTWLNGVVSNPNIEYSMSELAEEILAGSCVATEIYKEQTVKGPSVERTSENLPPVTDARASNSASDASIEALLGKHVAINFHVFAVDGIPPEQKRWYVESLALVVAAMEDFSDRQQNYVSALSRIMGIDDCGEQINFLRAYPRQVDVPTLVSVLSNEERQGTWLIDAIFLASSGGEFSPKALQMIRKVGEILDIKQGAMDEFLRHAKTVATENDARKIADAIRFIGRKTIGWKSVLDFRKISLKGAFGGLWGKLCMGSFPDRLKTSMAIGKAQSDMTLGPAFAVGNENFIQRTVTHLARGNYVSKFNGLKKCVEEHEASLRDEIRNAMDILRSFGVSYPSHSRSLHGISPDENISISNENWSDNMDKAFERLRAYLEDFENEVGELSERIALIESDDWNSLVPSNT